MTTSKEVAMRSRAALLLFVLATIPLSSLPASAGGNWIEFRDDEVLSSYLVPGSPRVAYATAYAKNPQKVKESGPYYAWLSRETYGWTLPLRSDRPGTVRLGRLSINWDRMKASISFTVPEVPPGQYLIAFCNSDCSQTFGDVDPTGGIQVFATALEARLTERVDKLDSVVDRQRNAARRANRRLERRLDRDIDEVGAEVATLDERFGNLSTTIDDVRKGTRPQLPGWTIIATAILAATAGFGIGRAHTEFRRRRAVDRELDELVRQP
jgi:hypothetical protein